MLGLWDGHGASVAVVAEGRLVFALAEARPSRRKRFSGFPEQALAAAMRWTDQAGLSVHRVALAGARGRSLHRLAEPLYTGSDPHREPLGRTSLAAMGWENGVARSPAGHIDARIGRAVVQRRLAAAGLRAPLITVDHHDAHAWSARFGRAERALVVTADAYGEGRSATVRRADTMDEVLASTDARFGLALLFGAVTVGLGFQEGDEGKVMGLAAHGDPEAAAPFDALFEGGVEPHLRRPLSRRRVQQLLGALSREDAAAGAQACVERRAAAWIASEVERSGCGRLLLAGGLFANVRLNQRLASLPGIDGIEVFVAMGDEGLSAGAAHRVWAARHGPAVCRDPRLGVAHVLPDLGVPTTTARVAEHLASERVVCRYSGREAFGPRALGNRSILFAARPAVAARVNAALGRDPIMAFAPVMTAEAAPALVEGHAGHLTDMTITARATDLLRQVCPAAVHLDGSVRPQVVHRAQQPALHELLTAAAERGLPALVNTSFNLHGEPIVHTPTDALRTWEASGLDVLLLGERELGVA